MVLIAPLAILRPAMAQDRGSSAGNELLLMGEQTVVTASKTVQRVQDVPAAVTVITEEEIRASGATTLPDLLRYAPGVDVSEQNHAVANVSIRGLNSQLSNKLLVMIDGRSVYQDFFGGIFWQFNPLLMSRIKRIEIVRGPGSALYGANAFNGVINIITKTPAEMATAARTTTRNVVGERNTQNLELQTTVGNPKDWSASLGLAYNHTGGFGGKSANTAHDIYTVPIVTLDIQKQLPRGSLLLNMGNVEAVSDIYETFGFDDTHSHNSFVSLSYAEDRARNPITARISGNFLKQSAQSTNYGDTQTLDVEVQQTRQIGKQNSLVYGGSYRSIASISAVTGPQTHHETLEALYLQDEFRISSQTSLFAGLRNDHNSLVGTVMTPRLSLVHHLQGRQSLRLSYGTAFHAPTILESYFNTNIGLGGGLLVNLYGNPALHNEKVVSYEAGYRKDFHRGFFGVNAYYNSITQFVGFMPSGVQPPPAPPGTPASLVQANAGSATVAGFEVESELSLGRGWHGMFNYAYEDTVAPDSFLFPIYTPKHKFNIGLRGNVSSRLETFIGAHFVGSAALLSAGGHSFTPSYTRVDARVAYRFTGIRRPWTIAVSATNLFDDHHVEYPIPSPTGDVTPQRRTLYLSLTGSM
jgi:iron complex outermembrane receptor protein